MSKKYTTPACTAISVRTITMIAGSPTNEYISNEGFIRFSSTEVSADDAD